MNKKSRKLQRILMVVAVVTVALVGTAVIYSLGFLSNNLLRALKLSTPTTEDLVEFNIQGFEALGL